MVKRGLVCLLVGMVALGWGGGPSRAQDGAEVALATYTFPDGTVVRYPATYTPQVLENPAEINVISVGTTTFYIDVIPLEEQAEQGIVDVFGAIDLTFVPIDPAFVMPHEDALELESNGVVVTWLRYEDADTPGTMQAAYLSNGSIMVIDAFGAFEGGRDEGIALAMLTDAMQDNRAFVADVAAIPPIPVMPQPVQNEVFVYHTFSDETVLRIGEPFEVQAIAGTNGDRRDVFVGRSQLLIHYHPAKDIALFELVDMQSVMEYSFFPNDEDLRFVPDAVRSLATENVEVFYWRYDDSSVPGTLIAVVGRSSGVLVIDAFAAYPNSDEEDYAFAMAFDYGGDGRLIEGASADIVAGTGDGVLTEE